MSATAIESGAAETEAVPPSDNKGKNDDQSKNIPLILGFTLLNNTGSSLWNQNSLSAFIFLLYEGRPEMVGYISGIQGIATVIASLPAGCFADIWRRDTVLKISSAVGILALGVTGLSCGVINGIILSAGIALWGSFLGISNTGISALFADSIKGGERGKYFTKRMMLQKIGNTFGPLTGIFVFYFLGNEWTLTSCAIVMIVGQLICFPAMTILCFLSDDNAVSQKKEEGKDPMEKGESPTERTKADSLLLSDHFDLEMPLDASKSASKSALDSANVFDGPFVDDENTVLDEQSSNDTDAPQNEEADAKKKGDFMEESNSSIISASRKCLHFHNGQQNNTKNDDYTETPAAVDNLHTSTTSVHFEDNKPEVRVSDDFTAESKNQGNDPTLEGGDIVKSARTRRNSSSSRSRRSSIFTSSVRASFSTSFRRPSLKRMKSYRDLNKSMYASMTKSINADMFYEDLAFCDLVEDEDTTNADEDANPNEENAKEEEQRGAGTETQHSFLCIPGHRVVPIFLAFTDLIAGFAAGMSIRYFPVFFLDNLDFSPALLLTLYTISPLLQAFMSKGALWCSKKVGRPQTIVSFKWTGVMLMFGVLVGYQNGLSPAAISTFFVLRQGFINSTAALNKSLLMDSVPKSERGKWSIVQSLHSFSWSGSAAVGGVLVGSHGIIFNFYITSFLQLVATLPLLFLFKRVGIERKEQEGGK